MTEFENKWTKNKAILVTIIFLTAIVLWIPLLTQSSEDEQETQTPTRTTNLKTASQPELIKSDNLEEKYTTDLQKINSSVQEALGFITNIVVSEPDTNSWSDEDTVKTVLYMRMIEESYEASKRLDPPSKYSQAHQSYVKALEQYSLAMSDLRKGLDQKDAEWIQLASETINLANDYMARAKESLPL